VYGSEVQRISLLCNILCWSVKPFLR